jgi:hypothetical protein
MPAVASIGYIRAQLRASREARKRLIARYAKARKVGRKKAKEAIDRVIAEQTAKMRHAHPELFED